MEGPSLRLAAEQLAPFKNRKILLVEGNSRIGKEKLKDYCSPSQRRGTV